MSRSTNAEPVFNGFDAARVALFSEIQVKLDEEAEHGQLKWVCETGWTRQSVAATNDQAETSAPALHAISMMFRLAYEKECHALLKFLFDTLANAVRDEGMGVASYTYCCPD